MAAPFTIVPSGGLPVTQSPFGTPITQVAGAAAVTIVESGGWPVTIVDDAAWSPSALFAGGEVGHWPGGFDPAGGRMYQDHPGYLPSVVDTPVGMVLDMSMGGAIGQEIVVDGDFLDPSAWISDGNWSIVGGVAVATGSVNGRTMYQPFSGTGLLGRTYKFETNVLASTGVAGWTIEMQAGGTSRLTSKPLTNTLGHVSSYAVYTSLASAPDRLSIVANSTRAVSVDYISIRRVYGWSAAQPTSAARPILRKTGGGVWYLEGDGVDDQMPVNLPAGTYTRAYVDSVGAVVIEDGVSISGAENILRVLDLADVLYVNRALTLAEKAQLTAYWEAMF